MVARRGDALAKKNDGGTARGCAGQKERWWHGDLIMHRPNKECQNRRLSRGVRWPYENARFGVLKSDNKKKEGIARIGFWRYRRNKPLALALSAPNEADRRWDAPA
jgi:hypothetical protein